MKFYHCKFITSTYEDTETEDLYFKFKDEVDVWVSSYDVFGNTGSSLEIETVDNCTTHSVHLNWCGVSYILEIWEIEL
jgi:hypothetical protein